MKILFMESDPDWIAEFCSNVHSSHMVINAVSSREALDDLASDAYDVISLTYELSPGCGNGLDVTKYLVKYGGRYLNPWLTQAIFIVHSLDPTFGAEMYFDLVSSGVPKRLMLIPAVWHRICMPGILLEPDQDSLDELKETQCAY